uniref:protein KRI1 homolog n=1 Tax=Styela clava TaxID=7725 RepID=UPI0019392D90|nr:protein KRI1 homolog [Styela clava]
MEDFKINEDFAKKYNKYRQKEELQKLKSRYGDVSSDSESSESEDENAEALTPGLERDFLRTLAYLKNKDPAIYDKSKKFYEEHESDESSEPGEKKKKNVKPMFLKDFERKVILENEGKFLEDDEEYKRQQEKRETSPSYQEEQLKLKEDMKHAISVADINENDEDGEDLLVKRNKSKNEKEKEEEEFRKWLKTPEGQTSLNVLDDKNNEKVAKMKTVVNEVKPLKEYWTDPKLDDGEKFLRDYILERKYLDPNADGTTPTYDEIIGADSDENEMSDTEDELFETKSENFERKYNFRYQENDQELIKSYPRTIGTSVRRKEDTRKKKRDEKKTKDEEKKRKKQEELKQLKLLKKKEILDKIQQLQEATGNKDLQFSETDLEVDFDPGEYDKRMQEIFNKYDNDYAVEEEKPVFSDIEENDYDNYWDENYYEGDDTNPDCENQDFVMDCDYDPAEHQRKKEQKKNKKNPLKDAASDDKKRKKSAFYDSVSKPKPEFDPNEKSFEKYLDEYYALDYEDLIGDLPCRFKYRQVIPNDFGLSTDEILMASDRELNSWCSLKRAVQYRKDEDEQYDIKKYKKKASNVWKKARVLKSVYKMPGEEEEEGKSCTAENNNDQSTSNENTKRKKMNSRKRRRLKERAEKMRLLEDDNSEPQFAENSQEKLNGKRNDLFETKRTKRKQDYSANRTYDKVAKLSDDRLKAYGLQPKKFLKKMKYANMNGNS